MKVTTKDILKLLEQNEGKPVSGESIAKHFGITRGAVWKHIKNLKEEGYNINSASHRGYELRAGMEVLNSLDINKYLHDKENGYRGNIEIDIEVRDEVSSTNLILKEKASNGEKEGKILIAKRQKIGRGRLGRKFFSPKNGIYLSFILRPSLALKDSVYLTTIAAVAVVDAINDVTGKQVKIKWVNDIYLDGRKICGILTEGSTDLENGRLSYAVVGIGINISKPENEKIPDELKDIIGFLCEEEEIRDGLMNRLVAKIIKNYFNYYEALPSKDFMKKYRDYQLLIGKEIFVIRPNEEKKAMVTGLDDEARLLVEFEDGSKEAIFTGEVSVRELEDIGKKPKFN